MPVKHQRFLSSVNLFLSDAIEAMEEYYIVTSREIPEGLDKGKKSEKKNPASMCKSRPVGRDSSFFSSLNCNGSQADSVGL